MANRTLIYINDQAVDLAPNTVVASTFKALEIGDMRTRNANYTNQFKLPKTPNNRRILQFSDSEFSQTTFPYIKLPAKVVQNGIEIIGLGTAIINNADSNFNIAIYSNTFDFFEGIGSKLMSEIVATPYDYYSGNTNTIISYPFIDYGQLNQTVNPMPFSGSEYPSCQYKKILELIIEQNGYAKSGNVFSDAKLTKMNLSALGYNGYNEKFRRVKEFDVSRNIAGAPTTSVTSSYTRINMTNIAYNGGYYDGTNTYTSQDPQGGAFGGTWYTFDVFARLDFTVSLAGGASGVDISLFSISGEYLRSGIGSGVHEFELSNRTSGSVSGIDGAEVYLQVRTTFGIGTATITWNSARMWNQVTKDIQPIYVSAQGVLPEIEQKVFLKDFAIRFGVLFKELNGTLYCKTINEIIADKANAVDWTSKRVTSSPYDISYQFEKYAQSNYFRDTNDDELDDSLGRGNITVANENIELSNDFYTSPFNISATTKLGNESAGYVTACSIPVYEDGQPKNDPGLRITMVRNKRTGEPTLAGGLSSYTVAYHIDPVESTDLDWSNFLTDHYSSLTASFEKSKLITRYYRLNEIDIAKLDFFVPVYDSGSYYILDTVSNFIPGISTKVELFKVV